MVAVAIPYPFPVLFEENSSFFREGLESFPEGIGEISARLSRYFPRNGPGRAVTNRKKVYDLHC